MNLTVEVTFELDMKDIPSVKIVKWYEERLSCVDEPLDIQFKNVAYIEGNLFKITYGVDRRLDIDILTNNDILVNSDIDRRNPLRIEDTDYSVKKGVIKSVRINYDII